MVKIPVHQRLLGLAEVLYARAHETDAALQLVETLLKGEGTEAGYVHLLARKIELQTVHVKLSELYLVLRRQLNETAAERSEGSYRLPDVIRQLLDDDDPDAG